MKLLDVVTIYSYHRNLLVRCNKQLGSGKSDYRLTALSPSSIRDHVRKTDHTASIDDFA